MADVKLTAQEAEFVAEMRYSLEDRAEGGWSTFDPPFLRRAFTRLLKRGWFEEERDSDPHYSRYRWTDAGRAALASEPKP